jgi:hypothetical protein
MTLNGSGPASVSATESGARKSDQLASEITSENNASAVAVKFHPLADIFPLMEGADFDALVADIKANGLNDRILLYDGMIIDGRNRYRALLAAGLEPADIDKLHCLVDARAIIGDDPLTFVISANLHRRHLTRKQKREVTAKLLKAQPEKSNRQIAKVAKVDDKTVGTVRAELEGRAEIPHVETRADTKGRKQPASKVKPDELVTAAAEIGIPESAVKAHGPQQAEAIRRIVQRKRKNRAKERIAAEMEGLANKLIELDLETARTLLEVLEIDDRHRIIRLTDALVRGIGRATCQALLSECRDGQ